MKKYKLWTDTKTRTLDMFIESSVFSTCLIELLEIIFLALSLGAIVRTSYTVFMHLLDYNVNDNAIAILYGIGSIINIDCEALISSDIDCMIITFVLALLGLTLTLSIFIRQRYLLYRGVQDYYKENREELTDDIYTNNASELCNLYKYWTRNLILSPSHKAIDKKIKELTIKGSKNIYMDIFKYITRYVFILYVVGYMSLISFTGYGIVRLSEIEHEIFPVLSTKIVNVEEYVHYYHGQSSAITEILQDLKAMDICYIYSIIDKTLTKKKIDKVIKVDDSKPKIKLKEMSVN